MKIVKHSTKKKLNKMVSSSKSMGTFILITAACTIVQAVVKAKNQSDGKGQISTPCGSETAERISMKLATTTSLRQRGWSA